jgi:hypothetical protein
LVSGRFAFACCWLLKVLSAREFWQRRIALERIRDPILGILFCNLVGFETDEIAEENAKDWISDSSSMKAT